MSKEVVIEMELMQLHIQNDLHKNVELQSDFWHAFDIPIDEDVSVELMKMCLTHCKEHKYLAMCKISVLKILFSKGIEPRSFDSTFCIVEQPAKPHISSTHPPS